MSGCVMQNKEPFTPGEEGLREIACLTSADMVLVAIVGTGGLRPALAAIEAGKDLAVASKEILVMAGEIVMREARDNGVHVLPVDSEHNAIFQCLDGHSSDVRRIILTASGGPFRKTPRKDFDSITPEHARLACCSSRLGANLLALGGPPSAARQRRALPRTCTTHAS